MKDNKNYSKSLLFYQIMNMIKKIKKNKVTMIINKIYI